MSLNLKLPEKTIIKPQITVFGVGGAGGNATNNMIRKNLQGAEFVVANTDAQALEYSESDSRIQLGETTTKGLGAGASPEVGQKSAEESLEEIQEHLQGSNMVFITAGMGGGTGTGAAPTIAKAARDMGILTVGVVTKPFHFEGPHRMRLAEDGIAELQNNVDTLIIIPNQNLFRIANEKTTFADAFAMADEVLYCGVRSITDLMIMPGLINLDFADVKAVMTEMGKAMMGTGEAEGEHRAEEAASAAISNPLLDNTSMKGARGVLINITGGSDMTLFEVDEAANRIRKEVDENANIIFGSTFDESLDGKMRVSVVATGIGDFVPNKKESESEIDSISETKYKSTSQNFSQQDNPNSLSFAATLNQEQDDEDIFKEEASDNLLELSEPESDFNKLSEDDALDEVFVARTPIEPGSSKQNINYDEIGETSINTEEMQDNFDHDEDKSQRGGFFKRFAAAAKSLHSSPKSQENLWDENVEEQINSITSNANKSAHKEALEPAESEKEESFDIPAFLRRKD